MKIRNNSNKVIGINGNVYLMPDQDAEFPKAVGSFPSIQALVRNGMLTITEDDEPVKEEPEEPVKEEPVKEEEQPVEKPKRTRRKKEEITE